MCSCTPRWRSPVHTSGRERPISACQSSGGRSSSATTMPTWLTGLLVRVWIARSAAKGPRNTHPSPVDAAPTASSRDSVAPATGRSLRPDAVVLEGHRAGRVGGRGRDRPVRRAQSTAAERPHTGGAPRAAAPPPRGGRPGALAAGRGKGGRAEELDVLRALRRGAEPVEIRWAVRLLGRGDRVARVEVEGEQRRSLD